MKFFFTAIALCATLTSFAQLEKGKFLVSGSASFGKSHYDNDVLTYSQGGVNIRGGYMVTDNFAVGASAQFRSYRSETKTLPALTIWETTKEKTYGASVFGRRFLSANDKLHFFFDGELFYRRNNDYSRTNNMTSDSTVTNRYGAAISPGVMFFVTKKIAVTTTVGELSYYRIVQPGSEVKFFEFDANFNISSIMFGATIVF